jgi:hypothetical protein
MACKMGKYKTRCIFDAGKQSLVYAAEGGKNPVSYMALSVRFSISESIGNGQRAIGNSLNSNLPVKHKKPEIFANRIFPWGDVAYWLLPFLRFFLLAHGIKLH